MKKIIKSKNMIVAIENKKIENKFEKKNALLFLLNIV